MPYDERSEPEQLMFSAEDFLASPSRAQESERARRTLDGSGRECLMSLNAFGRHGSSLKTFAGYFLSSTAWYSRLCALTWNLRATKSSRLYILLRASVRRTCDTEFLLLRTPQGSDGEGGIMEMRPGSRGRYKLRDQVQMFPTPSASMMTEQDMEQARYAGNDPRRPKYADALLPTPSAQEYGNNQSPSPGAAVRPSLSSMVRTPLGTDAKGGKGNLEYQIKRMLPTPRPCSGERSNGMNRTEMYRAMLPTPQANDAMNPHPPRFKKDRGSRDPNMPGSYRGDLKDVVMFPTPLASDGMGGPRTRPEEMYGGGMCLRDAIRQEIPGSLNPEFVEWLQGFPAGWTDCEPSGIP